MCMTPDGTRVITACCSHALMVWDTATEMQVGRAMVGPNGWVHDVAVMPDGQRYVSVFWTIRVWDMGLEACDGSHQVLEGHSCRVGCLCLATDGQHFVSLAGMETILWNSETAAIVKRINTLFARFMTVELIELSFGVARFSRLPMGDIRLGRSWNKITHEQNGAELVLAALDSNITSRNFSPVTKKLCVGLNSGQVGIFPLELGDDRDLVEIEELANLFSFKLVLFNESVTLVE